MTYLLWNKEIYQTNKLVIRKATLMSPKINKPTQSKDIINLRTMYKIVICKCTSENQQFSQEILRTRNQYYPMQNQASIQKPQIPMQNQ